MPEIIDNKQIFSLLEVTKSVQKTIAERYKSSFWVKAEMIKLNYYSHSGHCYPELVDKKDGKIIAQIKSNLWKDDYNNINKNFIKILKEPLKDGIKILFLAKISFDSIYGISLQILDIDPSLTLGDLEREKQETVSRLHLENIFASNKSKFLPLLPQRIAIISVETSKGYADFLKVLEENSWNYKFFHYLFPSVLQGEKAVSGIIAQLKRIEKVQHHFDVVAIIRGGGGDVGLSCYNNYDLSKAVAEFPLPVITGIGHATNQTVCEMVSYQNAITPTKISEFLIQKFHNFSVPLQKAKALIIDKSLRLLSDEKTKLQSEVKLFKSITETVIMRNRNEIENTKALIKQHLFFKLKSQMDLVHYYNEQLGKAAAHKLNENTKLLQQLKVNLFIHANLYLKQDNLKLENFERNLINLDPINILKRGYSITRYNGIAIKDSASISDGDTIETTLYNGTILSTIKNKSNG